MRTLSLFGLALLLLTACGDTLAAVTTPIALTSDGLIAALKAENLTVGETRIYTADTNPNKG